MHVLVALGSSGQTVSAIERIEPNTVVFAPYATYVRSMARSLSQDEPSFGEEVYMSVELGCEEMDWKSLYCSLALRSVLSTPELSIVQGQGWGRAVYGR